MIPPKTTLSVPVGLLQLPEAMNRVYDIFQTVLNLVSLEKNCARALFAICRQASAEKRSELMTGSGILLFFGYQMLNN